MVDKIFGVDFTDSTSPASSWTISVHNGTDLVDISLATLLGLAGTITNKNLLMNASMLVAQRGTSFTGVTSSQYILDRWACNLVTLGTHTFSQDTDVPSGYGFARSLKVLVTTADASPAAADALNITQRIEGRLCQVIRKGTSNAKELTVSFWVKSSTTGTYIVDMIDQDNTRQCSKSYTISAANTWELKSVTFPADTTGALDNDANNSLSILFWLAAGSNFSSGTLNTTWAATTNANRAVGQTNLAGTVNNYFNITGVQMELGPSATEFEFVPFDVEHLRCQRYYCKTFPYATAPVQNVGNQEGCFQFQAERAGAVLHQRQWRFPVTMRAEPTITTYNPAAANAQPRDITNSVDFSGIATAAPTNENNYTFNATGNAGTTAASGINVHITADADM